MRCAFLCATALAMTLAFGGAPRAQSVTPADTGDPVVAIVNGNSIHSSDVVMFHQNLPEQFRQIPIQMIYAQLLNQLVDRKLAIEAARQTGLADDAQVKRQLAFFEDRVLYETYFNRRIMAELTDERLRAAYDRMTAEAPASEEVRARHILLQSETDARAVIAELVGGADFVEVAKAKSTGPSAEKGGDLGFFGEGDMVPEFATAAFALQTGEVTQEPVKTQFGWHVIKVEERRAAAQQSFEASVNELRRKEAQQVAQEIGTALRDKAEIKLFNPDGSELVTPEAEPGEQKKAN
jgi:peptidyl-prolyl cis-trans isomerase C